MTDAPDDDAALRKERKKQKKAKERRRAADAARAEEAKAKAVREARAEWERESGHRGGRLRTMSTAVAAVALIGLVIFGILFAHKSVQYNNLVQLNRDKGTAESVAGKYAVGAATFTFNDIDQWAAALKKGTAKELNSRFDVAVKTLTPLIQEVRWSQTAELIAAKTVDIRDDRQFVVQVFVATKMTSTQNPQGLNTVTPYTITLDREEGWLITDVAGIGGVAQDGSTGSGMVVPKSGSPQPR